MLNKSRSITNDYIMICIPRFGIDINKTMTIVDSYNTSIIWIRMF